MLDTGHTTTKRFHILGDSQSWKRRWAFKQGDVQRQEEM